MLGSNIYFVVLFSALRRYPLGIPIEFALVCEMTTGHGFPQQYQPDKRRIATYRAGLGPDLRWDTHCASIAGNQE